MPPPDECHHNPNEDDMNSPTSPLNLLDQNYQELHQDCLTENTLYNDELFPPDNSSIGLFDDLPPEVDMSQVVWKRPSELVSDPNLIVDDVSRFDYAQGNVLGNCWFLAAIGALTFEKDIIKQVMPAEQSFTKDYAGIFHFRFWRFGKWIDVVIDDQLPTIDDELLFVCSKTSNEFWPALLEKAYAKVCGSYADLHAGFISEALMDFTGGTHMYYTLNTAPAGLWKIMECAFKSKTLMGCGSNTVTTPEENELLHGIITEHAYTVTGVFEVMSDENPVQLVRLLNPWGEEEWRGDWSDGSPLWDTVCEEFRKICHEVLNNGEFWMSMEDFTKIFENIDICCLCPDFLDGSAECHWTSKRHFGRWNAGTTAGGDIIKTETFWTNSQFRVKIDELNEECASGQRPENILVSLMQNHEKRHRNSQDNFNIGFYVFEIPIEMRSESGRFSSEFFIDREPVAQTDELVWFREVMKFFRLEPGEYLIVPCTENLGETASFVLSVFSKNETHLEHIQETPE
ncbi:calpain-2 catalytic subunit-like [Sinocyclocheilus grahami]|uniref:Calpain-2 catalytic subunit-like n=1 Tax=Sinocyclocheilus grahami TaxID=75366 RepID=A0A672NJN4_SINGR|nr:PREDICTED: calpain-2 catalytic subunit-like [Sinocyclocheilus grahami]XP_016099420.1 PREDICTED: calpain-2 catalytic subunit-like [Sinocyclocheilus grahami]XP_016099421.1 PREDICTED: calpain-2 catalytic subunit-like [Sinocyclocheilus grahami]